MTMSYFIIQKKHRLLKHSSDVLIIRMYLDIINISITVFHLLGPSLEYIFFW